MPKRQAITLAAALWLPLAAHAKCTPKDQQSRIGQVDALAAAHPDRAKQLSAALHQALLLEGDEICVSLDRLIAQTR